MTRRKLSALVVAMAATLAAGCTTSTSDGPVETTAAAPSELELPHREPPIGGIDAAEILAAAKAALPDATELTFPQGSNGYRTLTDSRVGYPDPRAGDITRGTPSVELSWEADGTVIFVRCSDLASAGVSSKIIAICTDLPITGIPAGGLASVWQSMSAGSWDGSQPFPPVTLSRSYYDADRPVPGPAIAFSISGTAQDGSGATATSDL